MRQAEHLVLQAGPPFGVVGYLLLGCWVLLALLAAVEPRRFFGLLSVGRVSLPERLVSTFRVLAALNAVASVYLIIRFATRT
jgi:hypothetical protein